MPSTSTIYTDLHVAGGLSSETMDIPDGAVTDASVLANAGVQASKLQHQHQITYAQGKSTDTPVTERKTLHVVHGLTGQLVGMKAMVNGAVVSGNATLTAQLKKNGANVLTADLVLNNTNSAVVRTPVSQAGFTVSTLARNDVLELDVTMNAGTGSLGQGYTVLLVVREDQA